MAKAIFVTATGTDVGKTFVSAMIVRNLRERGINCGYFKPVMSGVVLGSRERGAGSRLIESDANFVVEQAKIGVPAESCVSYFWREAVSPHLAAERAGTEISMAKIRQDFTRLGNAFSHLVVEGAGGITCPLRVKNGEKWLLCDLVRELDLAAIVVADAGLGTINSTLLTIEFARERGIEIRGVILNRFDGNDFMHRDNWRQIEYLAGTPVIATVPLAGTDFRNTNFTNLSTNFTNIFR